MDNMFDTGLAQRKATLGDAYVDKTFEAADDFRPFQEAMTAWCWGFGWGDGHRRQNTLHDEPGDDWRACENA